MRYPDFLKKGEAVGCPAPSFGAAAEPYATLTKNGAEKLRKLGFPVIFGPNAFLSEGVGISNTPEKCGAELTDMYCAGDTGALISVGGGELMCEILPYVDFGRVAAALPKWFSGYSDNTHFSFLLPTLCDTAAIYGPCVYEFGIEPGHESVKDAVSLLTGEKLSVHGYDYWEKEAAGGEDLCAPYNLTEKTVNVLRNWDGSPVTGRFLGGCLDCLRNFCGTRFDRVREFNERYASDGVIWFLEACDLSVLDIRRALWQLREAGWFSRAKGFIIGRPLTAFDQDLLGVDRFEAVTSVLGGLGLPVIMDADVGHLKPMMPLIEGGFGTMRYDERLRIDFELR